MLRANLGDNTRSDCDCSRSPNHEKAPMTDSQAPSPSPQTEPAEVEGLIQPGDIRSTSRSCLVIILVGLAIILLLCVFVVVQTWVR